MDNPTITLTKGFPPDQRQAAARLFWQAFRGKLAPLMHPEAKAITFLGNVADPDHVISALGPDGTLLGIAGFKTETGAFIGGELNDLQNVYGWLGGLWRGIFLSALERDIMPGVLLMDGIVVSDTARGQGIGTKLLTAIKDEAVARGCTSVRLDVIDSNPRARALYEREGFKPGKHTNLGPLRHLFGFRTATEMVCAVAPQDGV